MGGFAVSLWPPGSDNEKYRNREVRQYGASLCLSAKEGDNA